MVAVARFVEQERECEHCSVLGRLVVVVRMKHLPPTRCRVLLMSCVALFIAQLPPLVLHASSTLTFVFGHERHHVGRPLPIRLLD